MLGPLNPQSLNPRALIGPTLMVLVFLAMAAWTTYNACRIEVPARHMVVLTAKTGLDLTNDDEVAPGPEYKGVQIGVLSEGRYFRDPYAWSWQIMPQTEIPVGKLGVRIRLYGENLPYGEFLATKENQKGNPAGRVEPWALSDQSLRRANRTPRPSDHSRRFPRRGNEPGRPDA